MKRTLALIAALCTIWPPLGEEAQSANPPAPAGANKAKRSLPADTWRDGYKSGFGTASSFKEWDKLRDWANGGTTEKSPDGKHAHSTDLNGGRHEYTDSFAAGLKDARMTIDEEMSFIAGHNSGDTVHFFAMIRDWVKRQPVDEIIPPGHF